MQTHHQSKCITSKKPVLTSWRALGKKDPISSNNLQGSPQKFIPVRQVQPNNCNQHPIKKLIQRNLSNTQSNRSGSQSHNQKKQTNNSPNLYIYQSTINKLPNSQIYTKKICSSPTIQIIKKGHLSPPSTKSFKSLSKSKKLDQIKLLKHELNSFRKDVIRQINMLKEYSMSIVRVVTQRYQSQLEHYKHMKNIVFKNHQIKISTSSQTHQQLQNYDRLANIINQQKNRKKHHTRNSTQTLQYYKADTFKPLKISQQIQQPLKNQVKAQLTALTKQYLPIKPLKEQIIAERAQSFDKILQTLQKLKGTMVIKNKNHKEEDRANQMHIKSSVENNSKQKPILKKNSKYSICQMDALQNSILIDHNK